MTMIGLLPVSVILVSNLSRSDNLDGGPMKLRKQSAEIEQFLINNRIDEMAVID